MAPRKKAAAHAQAATGPAGDEKRLVADRAAAPNIKAVREISERLLNDSMGYAIRRAQIRSYDMFFRFLKDEDISPAKMTVLALIGVHQGISQSALAKQLGVNRAAMVKVIDALELQQLIERSPTDGDRRSYSLLITSQGQSKLKALQRKTEKYEQALTQALTEPERQLLISLLDKVGDGASSATSEV